MTTFVKICQNVGFQDHDVLKWDGGRRGAKCNYLSVVTRRENGGRRELLDASCVLLDRLSLRGDHLRAPALVLGVEFLLRLAVTLHLQVSTVLPKSAEYVED